MADRPAFYDEKTANWVLKQVRRIRPPTESTRPGGESTDTTSFWGMIWGVGPNTEDDYTDERYWVRRLFMLGDDTSDETENFQLNYHDDDLNHRGGDEFIVTASNISEITFDITGDTPLNAAGTHGVALHTLVYINFDVDSVGHPVWWFTSGGGGGDSVVLLGGSAGGLGWYYAQKVVFKSTINADADASLADIINGTKTDDADNILLLNLREVDSAASTAQLSSSGKPKLFKAAPTSMKSLNDEVVWVTDGIPICGT